MRARNLKPSFFKNEDLAKLPFEARLLFIGLWCLADREGRLENRPERIKAEVFPYDRVNIPKLLHVITSSGMSLHYTANSKQYIQVINFTKHQRPHPHEAKSEIPPPNDDVCLNPSSLNPDVLNPVTGATAHIPTKSASRFQQPTAKEVTAYAASIGFRLDGERFCAFYESKGWLIGKSPMKSWKAAVVTWKKDAPPTAMIVKPIYHEPFVERPMSDEEQKSGLEFAAKLRATLAGATKEIPK